jgi:hypothetical protein
VSSLWFSATPLGADILGVVDANSVLLIDPHTSAGAYVWDVDGEFLLSQQWYWLRMGSTGPESSLDTFTLTHHETHGTNQIHLTYDIGAGFTIDLLYTLMGGPDLSFTSTIAEKVTLANTGAGDIDLHLFEYTDLDIVDADFDTAVFVGAGHIRQIDLDVWPAVVNVKVTSGPTPVHWEIGEWPDILDKLEDTDPTTLSDTVLSHFGDATSAFQWDLTLLAGQEIIIEKEKFSVVPEPCSLALLGIGIGVLGAMRLRTFGQCVEAGCKGHMAPLRRKEV